MRSALPGILRLSPVTNFLAECGTCTETFESWTIAEVSPKWVNSVFREELSREAVAGTTGSIPSK